MEENISRPFHRPNARDDRQRPRTATASLNYVRHFDHFPSFQLEKFPNSSRILRFSRLLSRIYWSFTLFRRKTIMYSSGYSESPLSIFIAPLLFLENISFDEIVGRWNRNWGNCCLWHLEFRVFSDSLNISRNIRFVVCCFILKLLLS